MWGGGKEAINAKVELMAPLFKQLYQSLGEATVLGIVEQLVRKRQVSEKFRVESDRNRRCGAISQHCVFT